MKNNIIIVLFFILGFLSHKIAKYAYEYSFQKAFSSATCMDPYVKDVESRIVDAPLTKRFRCTEKEMGIIENLKYILLRPSALSFEEDWVF